MSLFCAVGIYPTTLGRIIAGQEVLPLAKTMLNVISVFDGTEDATDVFVSLIARKIREVKQQDCRFVNDVLQKSRKRSLLSFLKFFKIL